MPKKEQASQSMIDLTRLNGHRLTINCELIKHAEASPDTVLTLITGEKLVVLESCDGVVQRVLQYRASILKAAWPNADAVLSAKAAFEVHSLNTNLTTNSDQD
jgi:flagellar protein FlbD